ncbi:hypothetical protein A8C56_20185 [Niabella ginsenosidivorans]|uniref:DUF2007 domain-containing protein n=1 Tax=Niabella ginsenosidivorans TaxID=1176587 RepID=A0A1A9I608_9BACT|nr:DUF2007 domain-containing protein [Niabella ginsenosidivorans]ANH82993.1 hypothetical protein A8C56_20185 [Niabella ginsenosidivorans]
MDYVIASTYNNYIEAHLAMGNLQSESINCWLKDENTVTIDPILTNAVGGIKLMVAQPQIGRALDILKNTKKEYQQQHPCPHCGSTNVEYVSTPKKASNWLGTLINLLLGIGAPLPVDKVHHCFDCGYEYEAQ